MLWVRSSSLIVNKPLGDSAGDRSLRTPSRRWACFQGPVWEGVMRSSKNASRAASDDRLNTIPAVTARERRHDLTNH